MPFWLFQSSPRSEAISSLALASPWAARVWTASGWFTTAGRLAGIADVQEQGTASHVAGRRCAMISSAARARVINFFRRHANDATATTTSTPRTTNANTSTAPERHQAADADAAHARHRYKTQAQVHCAACDKAQAWKCRFICMPYLHAVSTTGHSQRWGSPILSNISRDATGPQHRGSSRPSPHSQSPPGRLAHKTSGLKRKRPRRAARPG